MKSKASLELRPIIKGPIEIVVHVQAPLFCPYHNVWGKNVYELSRPFAHNPFTIPASSTSGSPVIQDAEGRFFGFMNDQSFNGAEFRYDGAGQLTICVPEGQSLWMDESAEPNSWRAYNRAVLSSLPPASRIRDFWCDVEYCTWVEQKALALITGCHPHHVLNHDFVRGYIQKIEELELPKGKLTLDHGWQNGDETYGDWDVHPERFPDLRRTVDMIRESGFTPGLWMAPIWLHPASAAARTHPDWLGPKIHPATPDSPVAGDWNYFNPVSAVQDHLQDLFARFHAMGFMKFKFDMSYADKQFMKSLHRMIYRAVKNVSEDIEVEIHQPDIFFTTCCDAVRTNDILCNNDYPHWRALTQAHIEVCNKSAPGRVINLDHIGGNDPSVSAETYTEHLDIYRTATGHPVVSLLPSRFGAATVDGLRNYLQAYAADRSAVSTYSLADLLTPAVRQKHPVAGDKKHAMEVSP